MLVLIRPPGDLFGARVAESQRAQARGLLRQCLVGSRVEHFRDAEIEQLHDAGRCHQNVRGLQIAMDNQMLMRVLNGRAHSAQQRHAVGECHVPLIAVDVDRLSVDVFDDGVGKAFVGGPAVEQPGNVRMIEARDDLAFLIESAVQPGVARLRPENLDGDRRREDVVRAFGEVNDSHAASAEFAERRILTNPPADEHPRR